jgi:secreted trypsin-like serine protease
LFVVYIYYHQIFLGGPLQIYNNDPNAYCTYTIIGATSFGIEQCGTPKIPGVYVNIFGFLDWIENIVWPGEK